MVNKDKEQFINAKLDWYRKYLNGTLQIHPTRIRVIRVTNNIKPVIIRLAQTLLANLFTGY